MQSHKIPVIASQLLCKTTQFFTESSFASRLHFVWQAFANKDIILITICYTKGRKTDKWFIDYFLSEIILPLLSLSYIWIINRGFKCFPKELFRRNYVDISILSNLATVSGYPFKKRTKQIFWALCVWK